MTIPTSQALEAAKTALEREERLRLFLEILSAMGGQSDATESRWSWTNAFCEDHEGFNPDTFNLAIDRGFTTTGHDTSYETATVYLTDAGRAALADLSHVPEGEEGGLLPPLALHEAPRLIETWIADEDEGSPVGLLIERPDRLQVWSGEASSDAFDELDEDERAEVSGASHVIIVGRNDGSPIQILGSAVSVEAAIIIVRALAHSLPPQQASMDGSELKAPSATPQEGWRPDREVVARIIDPAAFGPDVEVDERSLVLMTRKDIQDRKRAAAIVKAGAILALPSANSGVG